MRGKAHVGFAGGVADQDHPRLCGEKEQVSLAEGNTAGSPPPMRGKVEIRVVSVLFVGITPAYAGKSGVTAIGEDCF